MPRALAATRAMKILVLAYVLAGVNVTAIKTFVERLGFTAATSYQGA